MPRVAVIGGGVFGTNIAIELSKNFDVTLFERGPEILTLTHNYTNRHHLGFHYPRSPKTVKGALRGKKIFDETYPECVFEDVDAYYFVSNENTMTNAEEYLKFCDELGLPYEVEMPPEGFVDKEKIDLSIKTPEGVYDSFILADLIRKRLDESNANVLLNHEVKDISLEGTKKIVTYENSEGKNKEEFDIVVNAMYSNYNLFNEWLGLPHKKALYEIVEMVELDLPIEEKIAMTKMDGEFSSIIPRGNTGNYILLHVDVSLIRAKNAKNLPEDMFDSLGDISRVDEIMQKGIEDYPILSKAKVLGSIFSVRTVKADVEDTDERPTEVKSHGNGIYSVFSGKVNTCVIAAQEMHEMIKEEFNIK